MCVDICRKQNITFCGVCCYMFYGKIAKFLIIIILPKTSLDYDGRILGLRPS